MAPQDAGQRTGRRDPPHRSVRPPRPADSAETTVREQRRGPHRERWPRKTVEAPLPADRRPTRARSPAAAHSRRATPESARTLGRSRRMPRRAATFPVRTQSGETRTAQRFLTSAACDDSRVPVVGPKGATPARRCPPTRYNSFNRQSLPGSPLKSPSLRQRTAERRSGTPWRARHPKAHLVAAQSVAAIVADFVRLLRPPRTLVPDGARTAGRPTSGPCSAQ